MEFPAWEPEYRRILQEFGFSREGDARAARVLVRELRKCPQVLWGEAAHDAARQRLVGCDAVIMGAGPGVRPPELRPPPSAQGPWKVIAADAATRTCLEAGVLPDVVVTDLDGSLPEEVEAGRRGALSVLHAHGDNVLALEAWVHLFRGPVLGTCAGEPFGGLLNFGGFTDGDRCVFLAEACGVRTARLVGFDFDNPWGEPETTAAQKRRKLAVARRLVGTVAARGLLRVEVADLEGAVTPWPA